MPFLAWSANTEGQYWIDVQLAGQPFEVLVGTGMVDRLGEVGFSINPSDYDAIKNANGFEITISIRG